MSDTKQGDPRERFGFRVMTDAEVAEMETREPVPIYCRFCCDTGTLPDDPIFVNTAHSYGIEYRSEKPCPHCSMGDDAA